MANKLLKKIGCIFLSAILVLTICDASLYTSDANDNSDMTDNDSSELINSDADTDTSNYGIYLSNYTLTLDENSEFQLVAIVIPSGNTVGWISSDSSVASVSSSGKITAHKASRTPVTITAYTIINMQMYTASCSVTVKISDGMYLLSNKATGLYADATSYSENGSVVQWSYHGGYNQRWIVEYLSDGSYSLKNAMSGLYLGIESVGVSSANAIQTSILSDTHFRM